MTDLKDKAVSIKGRDYILVKDRIVAFNNDFPEGQIKTEVISHKGDLWVVKATVWPKWTEERCFSAHSQARESQGMVNKMAALENAETSACGRALAMMGIGVIDSIASVDEMKKAGVTDPLAKVRLPQEAPVASPVAPQDAEMARDVDESLQDGHLTFQCMKCQSPADFRQGTNKAGKPYRGYFCTNTECGHVQWMKII